MPIAVLVITGPVGGGKSAVSRAVSDLLVAAGVPHGVLDLDSVRHCHPGPPSDPFHMALGFRNLAAVAANYRAAGANRLVLVDIVETRRQVKDYRVAIPDAEVSIVGLRAALPTIHARLAGRESGADLDWHRRRAADLIEQWRRSPVADLSIDTEGQSIDEVARSVLRESGWL